MRIQYADRGLSAQLRHVLDSELRFLREREGDDTALRSGGPQSWSPKEELGHLIDSAANNHMRFVRGALEPVYEGPGYAQNAWVDIHGYQEMPWRRLVGFFLQYNLLLADLIERIPREAFDTPCTIGGGAPVPLGFVIEDYILHLRHHLDRILGRAVLTEYPGRADATLK